MVGWWRRMRVTTTRWSAALACRLPPWLSLCRLVRPLDAGIGQAPHSLAKAPSDRMRSGLSPMSSSISAAVAVAMPRAAMRSGAEAATSAPSSRSCASISSSSASQRPAMALSAAFADAVVETIGPGRIFVRCRTSASLPRMPSSCSGNSAGALTMMALSVSMAWVLALTAASRAIFKWRIISTEPVPDFGSAVACPPSTARAAASASSGSSLPRWRRALRSGRLTSRTRCPASRRARERPAPALSTSHSLAGTKWLGQNGEMTPEPATYPGYRFPTEIISYAVWLYHVFGLSLRDVELILSERGITVNHESIRQWCRKFGADFARKLRQRRPKPGDTWHLDEVFLKINTTVALTPQVD